MTAISRESSAPHQAVVARAPQVVVCERPLGLLLVPVKSGVADLADALALTGSARVLWEHLRAGVPIEDARRRPGAGEVEPGIAAFLEDLVRRGVLESPAPPGSVGVAATSATATATVTAPPPFEASADDVEALARAVLGDGLRFRFRARGLSMRPLIPDSSVIDVRPATSQEVRAGDVVLYATAEHRLVAHRVVGRRGEALLARGDAAARLDLVPEGQLLGVVVARREVLPGGEVRDVELDTAGGRFRGRVNSAVYRGGVMLVRAFVIAPLRHSGLLRAAARFLLKMVSALLRRIEDRAYRWRTRIDTGRSGLLSDGEKDRDRRRLYARRAVRDFTALDENLEAGLTLIEEVILHRHPQPAGRVLVLGCGPGRECLALTERGETVVGLERDEGMLACARELALRKGASITFVHGEAHDFRIAGEAFDQVLVWSGLYNMLLPRERRLGLLRSASAHLKPNGRVVLTFLSDYVAPGSAAPPKTGSVLQAINPAHEPGDRYLLNEAIHVFPHPEHLEREARDAGFRVDILWRDQRAYDRARGQVRGYAILVPAGDSDRPGPHTGPTA